LTTDLNKPTWVYVARKTLREFSADQCTDLAAALTHYAVLALFPTAIALLSLVGIFGQGSKTVDTLLRVVSEAGGSSVAQRLRPTLETLSQTPGAGLALILGLLGALWSASGYVGAFGRAMNRIYGIGEGRPVWKLRPVMLLVTLVLVVLVAVAVLALIVSGPRGSAGHCHRAAARRGSAGRRHRPEPDPGRGDSWATSGVPRVRGWPR